VAFSEGEGGFEGFEEAGVVLGRQGEAVLDDVDDGRNEFRGPWFVGADDFAVEEDAEVALGVEEGEDFLGFRVRRDRDGEGDQHGHSREVF